MSQMPVLTLADHPGRQLLLAAGCVRLTLGVQALAFGMVALAGANAWAGRNKNVSSACDASNEGVLPVVLPVEPVVARAPRSRSVKKGSQGSNGVTVNSSPRSSTSSTRRRKSEV